jgi:hypothetical protein
MATAILIVSSLFVPLAAHAVGTLIVVKLNDDVPSAIVTATREASYKTLSPNYSLPRDKTTNTFVSEQIDFAPGQDPCADENSYKITVKDITNKQIATQSNVCTTDGQTATVTISISASKAAAAAAEAAKTGHLYGTIKVKEPGKDGGEPILTPVLPGTRLTLTSATDNSKNYSFQLPEVSDPGAKPNGKYAINLDIPVGFYVVSVTGSYVSPATKTVSPVSYTRTGKLVKAGRKKYNIVIAAKIDDTSDDDIKCSAGSFEWFLCPLISIANNVMTFSEEMLNSLLKVKPLSLKPNDTLYQTWSFFRNFADILFILVFLVIIFGAALGLDSYTIKKTIPRVIAAAILVQFSYYFAAFIIDLGNIAGGGLEALVNTAGINDIEFDFTKMSGFLTTGIITALGIPGIFVITLVAVISATIAVMVIVATLLLRQVLITTLVLLSPLAMVAWVLPNTQKIFKFWFSSLVKATLLYPIIIMLFIAGRLATTVALQGKEAYSEPLAMIIYVLPLFLVPFTFSAAGKLFNMGASATGKLGNQLNKPVGKGSDFADRREATKQYKNSVSALRPISSTNRLGRAGQYVRRGIATKRAGFSTGLSFKPNAAQESAMTAIANKEFGARLARANRDLDAAPRNGLSENEFLLNAALDNKDDILSQAAVTRLASIGAIPELERVLKERYGNDPANASWQSAVKPSYGDLMNSAPHLLLAADELATKYQSMTADKVVGLSDAGIRMWIASTATPEGLERRREIGRQIAKSKPLQGKLAEHSRKEINAATGGHLTINPATNAVTKVDDFYIPTAIETDGIKKMEKNNKKAEQTRKASDATVKAVNQLNMYIFDPGTIIATGDSRSAIQLKYANEQPYHEAVDKAIVSGHLTGVFIIPDSRKKY